MTKISSSRSSRRRRRRRRRMSTWETVSQMAVRRMKMMQRRKARLEVDWRRRRSPVWIRMRIVTAGRIWPEVRATLRPAQTKTAMRRWTPF